MPQTLSGRATLCSLMLSLAILNSPVSSRDHQIHTPKPKIQVAILLDVSGSMSGLIDQAKNQLWNMVNVLSKVTCEGIMPSIEIALYEYGRTTNDVKEGFVKQISPFTQDLDKLFTRLIELKTDGGEEYCGHVMVHALDGLSWDTMGNSYKVIFIAGNESFFQGNVSFTIACEKAKKKGVIVNTIYCGNREYGIKEHWDLGTECGNGSFSNIDHNAKPLSIPTPYDDSIISLKEKLNATYVFYGERGQLQYERLFSADTVAVYNLNDPSKITQYIVVKSNPRFNSNSEWDLVDAYEKNPAITDTVNVLFLSDSLKNKNRQQLKLYVQEKARERKEIQNRVSELSLQQDKFIRAEKEKQQVGAAPTLESEIEKIIREQVQRVNMKIK